MDARFPPFEQRRRKPLSSPVEPSKSDTRADEFSPPWLKFYGGIPTSLPYPRATLYAALKGSARRAADSVAYEFLSTTATYAQLAKEIDRCADSLAGLGLKRGERITIAMPNSPQAITALYAANKLGVVASMIHPLSTPSEIAFYLNQSRSRCALTLDAFYQKFAEVRDETPLEVLILARIADYLSPIKRIGFWLTRGRKIRKVPANAKVVWWSELVRGAASKSEAVASDPDELAVILYSGGTTGKPKGVMFSHHNLISEGLQVVAWSGVTKEDRILAVLPVFHGFGLSALINAPLLTGACVALLPIFNERSVAAAMRQTRPTIIAGVPTLYDALSKNAALRRTDLSFIRSAFSGGDTLPMRVKDRFEALVNERGGKVELVEGYGLTEAVTAVIATPAGHYREGSIGIPFPDMRAKIIDPQTGEELPRGENGELCISGPAVMLGYLDDPKATAEVLRVHADGRVWLHTGDLCNMDADGFFYFTSRLKQLIKSSGMSVYPRQVEAVLLQHAAVREACVVGVPDEAQGERVVAVVAPRPKLEGGSKLERELIDHCSKQLIKWSCPRQIFFQSDLPKTPVGKFNLAAIRDLARARSMN